MPHFRTVLALPVAASLTLSCALLPGGMPPASLGGSAPGTGPGGTGTGQGSGQNPAQGTGNSQAPVLARIGGTIRFVGEPDQSGITVTAYPHDAPPGSPTFSGTTDAQGAFGIDVPAGTYNLVARKPGTPFRAIKFGVQSDSTVAFDLVPTGTIKGKVTAAPAADLAGTTVFVPGTDIVAITGSDGSYALTGVPVGTYELWAMHGGYTLGKITGVAVTTGQETAAEPVALTAQAGGDTGSGGGSGSGIRLVPELAYHLTGNTFRRFAVKPRSGDVPVNPYILYLVKDTASASIDSSGLLLINDGVTGTLEVAAISMPDGATATASVVVGGQALATLAATASALAVQAPDAFLVRTGSAYARIGAAGAISSYDVAAPQVPGDLVFDSNHNAYFTSADADLGSTSLYKIGAGGQFSTIASTTSAAFSEVSVDPSGNAFVISTDKAFKDPRILSVGPDGAISTIATASLPTSNDYGRFINLRVDDSGTANYTYGAFTVVPVSLPPPHKVVISAFRQPKGGEPVTLSTNDLGLTGAQPAAYRPRTVFALSPPGDLLYQVGTDLLFAPASGNVTTLASGGLTGDFAFSAPVYDTAGNAYFLETQYETKTLVIESVNRQVRTLVYSRVEKADRFGTKTTIAESTTDEFRNLALDPRGLPWVAKVHYAWDNFGTVIASDAGPLLRLDAPGVATPIAAEAGAAYGKPAFDAAGNVYFSYKGPSGAVGLMTASADGRLAKLLQAASATTVSPAVKPDGSPCALLVDAVAVSSRLYCFPAP